MDPSIGELILITGAGGFLASHIISQLLEKNYHIRGTVRNLSDLDRYKHITSLPKASTHLELIELDYTDEKTSESWSKAFAGDVKFVFHVGGPHKPVLNSTNPVTDIIDPIIKGTKTLCELCDQHISVKRLVLTSCIDAIADSFVSSKEYNEIDWNDISTAVNNPHAYSKTLAERSMYRYFDPTIARDTNSTIYTNAMASNQRIQPLQVISILPGTLLGPSLTYAPAFVRMATWREAADESLTPSAPAAPLVPKSAGWKPHLSASHKLFLSYLNGSNRGVPNLYLNISDVRDVATAHVIAMEATRITSGRYIVAQSTSISHLEMLQAIHENFPDEVKVPTRKIPDRLARIAGSLDKSGKGEYLIRHLGKQVRFNTIKSKEVGMAIRPPIQTIVDTCRFMIENSLIEQQSPQGCSIL